MNKELQQDSLSVFFSISNVCNYSCDYCIRYNIMKEAPNLTVSIDNIDLLLDRLKKYNLYNFTILGGEPCICKNTYYLLDRLKDLNLNKIVILTNGSNINFFKEISTYNINNLRISISFHPKYYSQKYIDNINYISDNFETTVNILMDETQINNIELLRNKIDKNLLEYTILEDKDLNSTENIRYIHAIGKYLNLIHYFKKNYNIEFKDYNNFLNQYYNKDCYNNSMCIRSTGLVSYKSCFSKNNKKFNIFGPEDYVHKFSKIKCLHKIMGPCNSCDKNYHG